MPLRIPKGMRKHIRTIRDPSERAMARASALERANSSIIARYLKSEEVLVSPSIKKLASRRLAKIRNRSTKIRIIKKTISEQHNKILLFQEGIDKARKRWGEGETEFLSGILAKMREDERYLEGVLKKLTTPPVRR